MIINRNVGVAVISTIIMIVYITLDGILDNQLWVINNDFTIYLQANIFPGEKLIFDFFTDTLFLPPAIAFVCFVLMDCKLNVMIYLMLCVGSTCLNEIIKNLYHQPRPYMVEDNIKGYHCNMDFGKPSGHAQCSLVMVFTLPLLIFPSLYNLKKNKDIINQDSPIMEQLSKTGYTIDSFIGWSGSVSEPQIQTTGLSKDLSQSYKMRILKASIIILMTCSVFMTGLSRIFLGVHSIGQVLLGWMFGLYFIIIFISIVNSPMKRHTTQIFHSFKQRTSKYRYLIPMTIFMLILLTMVSIITLELNKNVFKEQDLNKWLGNINKCLNYPVNQITANSPQVLYNGCFALSFIGAIITGMILGGLMTKGSYKEGQFFRDFIRSGPADIAKRFAILVGIYSTLIPFYFIKSQSVYIQTFLQVKLYQYKILPVSFLVGFILNFVYPKLCHQFNIQLRGDMFYLNISDKHNDLLDVFYLLCIVKRYDCGMSLESKTQIILFDA